MEDTCANPLLLGWIKEWLDLARERNSRGVTVFVPVKLLSGNTLLTKEMQIQESLRVHESLPVDVQPPF